MKKTYEYRIIITPGNDEWWETDPSVEEIRKAVEEELRVAISSATTVQPLKYTVDYSEEIRFD